MTKRRRRSWSPEEKSAIAAEARRRASRGQPLDAVARELGLHPSTLRLWLAGRRGAALQPVVIAIDDVEAPIAAAGPTISLATPDGFVFDGLDLASALRLWERLR